MYKRKYRTDADNTSVASGYARDKGQYTYIKKSNFYKDYFNVQFKKKNYAYCAFLMAEYDEYFTDDEHDRGFKFFTGLLIKGKLKDHDVCPITKKKGALSAIRRSTRNHRLIRE